MHKNNKRVNLFIGDANDGHAELIESSLRNTGMVNKHYRGFDGSEMLELVCGARKGCVDEKSVPSIVFLDCELPQVGGISVLSTINSERQYSWIPVVMMTTSYTQQQAEQCNILGCEDYITKWRIFLGLPDFVRRFKFLVDRSIWIYSRRYTHSQKHNFVSDSLDVNSVSEVTWSNRRKQQRIAKEDKDEIPT